MSDESPRDCPPRYATPRTESRRTLGTAAERIAAQLGTPLMPWQKQVLDTALEIENGQFVYREAIVTVPRQQGKSTAMLALIVARALHRDKQSIVYTAQSRADARKKWGNDWLPALKASPFEDHYTTRLANGDEAIIFKNGSRQELVAGTKKSGHGAVLDMAIIDEAFAQPDGRLEQALRPAMITRNRPRIHSGSQLWVVSTAGTYALSPYLWSKVERGREIAEAGLNRSVAYFEWSASDDDDPLDEETWWRCMPALGRTASIESIRSDFMSMELHEAERAYANRWCVLLQTRVSCADGALRPASDLRIGDEVLAYDEFADTFRAAPITGVLDNGAQPLYEITTRRGRVTRVTGNHLFWVASRGRNPGRWIRADDLTLDDRILTERGAAAPHANSDVDFDLGWFLGAMTGDGTCSRMRFTNMDRNVSTKMRTVVEAYGATLVTRPSVHYPDGVYHDMVMTKGTGQPKGRHPIRLILEKHGLWDKIDRTKHVPETVFTGGHAAWCGFLSGYLDTDGCVSVQRRKSQLNGQTIFVSVSERLLRDVQHLLAMLGAQSSLIFVPNAGTWRLEVTDVASNAILARDLRPAHRKKRDNLQHIANNVGRIYLRSARSMAFDRIRSIEVLEPGPTIGLEVEGLHTHITDGLVSHNTSARLDPVVPLTDWQTCAVDELDTAGIPVVLSVDVSPGRDRAAIAASGWLDAEQQFVEIVEHRSGVDWVAPLVERVVNQNEVQAVVLDPASPASSLVKPLLDRGVETYQIQARELAEACAGFYDAVVEHRLAHPGQRAVMNALDGAAKRAIGDGGWGWGRKNSAVDITPIVSVTLAHWGAASQLAGGAGLWSLDEIVTQLRAQQAGGQTAATQEPPRQATQPDDPAGVFTTPI